MSESLLPKWVRVLLAGVPTELHVYPGAFHASEHLTPAAALSHRIVNTRMQALCLALKEPEQMVAP